MTVDETRDLALGALYAADSRSMEEIDVTKVPRDAGVLADRVWSNRERIDAAISEASTRWRIQRMPLVDRNILRLGTYELLYTDLPIAIPINECVELAKLYGTANSSSFINGVLDALAQDRDKRPAAEEPNEDALLSRGTAEDSDAPPSKGTPEDSAVPLSRGTAEGRSPDAGGSAKRPDAGGSATRPHAGG